ncbi:MAG: glycosyltransferase family 2 protein [Deltaproteobacteria bacterium]|nr:glycosyltransferase family 2 protein [Deltaproteobacteria bacterium]
MAYSPQPPTPRRHAQTPLSALIITHRGGALLARGLAALRPQLGPLDTLHVAVSNVPGAADLSACAAFGAEVLHLGENVGFAKAANLGLAACARALILLLNDDTAPLPGFIDALRAAAVARPGLYQPRILLSDGSGRLDNTGHGLFPDGFNWVRGREDHDSPAYDLPGEVGACSGAALLVHRDVLDAIGPFEGSEALGEDVDSSARPPPGLPLIYVPEARIVHDLGATYGRYTPRKVFSSSETGCGRRSVVADERRAHDARLDSPASGRLGGGFSFRARLERAGGVRGQTGGLAWPRRRVAAAPDALAKRRADADHWALRSGRWGPPAQAPGSAAGRAAMRAAVIVGLNVHATLPAVLAALPPGLPTFVVDDGSEPPLTAPAGVTLLRHNKNRGYGAAQRTGYQAALAAGATRIALVHGDGQYDVGDVLALLDALDDADVALGSRFLAADGGAVIPSWRRLGNRALTAYARRRLGIQATELHTGARAFRAEALRALPLEQLSDDYVFDQQVLVRLAVAGFRFAERPARARYDESVQSISLWRSIGMGWGV